MPKQLEINKEILTYEQVCGLYTMEKDGTIKTRLQIIILWYEGQKSGEIAKTVKQTGATVRKYMKRYNRKGLSGLKNVPRPGMERKITEKEMREIDDILKKTPKEAGMEVNNWRGWVLQKWIAKQLNKEVTVQTCYNILHRLKYSKTRAKKQNKKRDPEQATTGETRKRTVIFGAVNPETGDLFEQFSDAGDTVNFQSFLSLIAGGTSGKKVILIEDNAAYHHFKGIDEWIPENVPNISLVYLPSYCSDLNPTEHLWKHTRTNVSHNTLFDTFDLLVSGLKDFLAKLKGNTLKIAKLCPFIY